ncbi:MAG TPA: DNA-3-methyladenine glycosylase 2 family protein, partial [candidate division Zixibacteria bacterium]|nr:DNA-3-methyladenine glycosylase 2 family protein [candidate division Zixibacteria bacterium]
RYYRAIPYHGKICPVEVKSVGEIEKPRILARSLAGSPEKYEQNVIAQNLKTIFRIGYSLHGFYEFCKTDHILKRLSERYYGLINLQTVDPFEILVWAITGQQMSLKFAFRLKRRLVEKYGKRFQVDGKTIYTFPKPEVLAGAKTSDLLKMQYSRNKADYIKSLAASVTDRKIDLEKLRGFDDNTVRDILTGIRGIGGWSCEYAMLRSLGRDDACPSADAGLRRALAENYGIAQKSSEKDVDNFMKRFMPFRGMATYYLWFGLLEKSTKDGVP